jgi:hypothetical protein
MCSCHELHFSCCFYICLSLSLSNFHTCINRSVKLGHIVNAVCFLTPDVLCFNVRERHFLWHVLRNKAKNNLTVMAQRFALLDILSSQINEILSGILINVFYWWSSDLYKVKETFHYENDLQNYIRPCADRWVRVRAHNGAAPEGGAQNILLCYCRCSQSVLRPEV